MGLAQAVIEALVEHDHIWAPNSFVGAGATALCGWTPGIVAPFGQNRIWMGGFPSHQTGRPRCAECIRISKFTPEALT